MRGSRLIGALLILIHAFALTACNPDYDGMGERRVAYSQNNTGDINIAVIKDQSSNRFVNGIMLGVAEINQRPGKLLTRSVRVITETDPASFDAARPAIERIIQNPQITAVLGHRLPEIAIPASALYENGKVVFISPFATSKKLTKHNFQYTFRMMPSNVDKAEQIASVANTLGYEKIVILYAREAISSELAFLFEEAAIERGIELIKRASFFSEDTNYRSIISQFNEEEFDAVFIAAQPQATGLMARQLREMNIEQPILADDTLSYSSIYQQIAGEAANKTIIPTIFTPSETNLIRQQFIKRYEERYGEQPDYSAAQGYDSIMVLATAIERAGSTQPALLSSTLRYMPAQVGVTGIHAFDQSGDIRGKSYTFRTWFEEHWQDLPAVHIPYLLERFEKDLQTETSRALTAFSDVFSKQIGDDDHSVFLLDLAQEILRFERIGIIFENSVTGRAAADYQLITRLAEQKGLTVVNCEVFFSLLSQEETELAMLDCYGKLIMNADALFIPGYRNVDTQFLRQLNENLVFFKIPTISLDTRNTDPNLTLVLSKRRDIDQTNFDKMAVYRNLLSTLKFHEFAERLQGLPELSVNLANLQSFDLPEKAIINLSPDNYLYTHDTVQNEAISP